MALTITVNSIENADNALGKTRKKVKGTIAFDNSYVTNGMTLLPSAIGLKTIEEFFIQPANYSFNFITSTNKIKVYQVYAAANTNTAFAEATSGADLSALTAVPFLAEGTELV